MKIQDLTPPVAVPEPAWKQQLVEFWQRADSHHKLDLEVTLKMGDAAGARRVIESWQQEVVERQKQQAAKRKKKSKKKSVRYGYGGYWFPGTAYAGQDHPDGAEGGAGGESIRESQETDQALQQFFKEIVADLDIEQAPKIVLHHDSNWSKKNGTFGRYDPKRNSLELAVSGRHVMDIVRTMAHELVHCRQNEISQLPGHAGETGSPWEDEANAVAGRILRGVAARHPELFKHDVAESSGYIPTARERNDPRFKMALSVDVKPGATGKNANRLALKTGAQGEPTLLMKELRNALREFKATDRLPLTESEDLFEIDMSPSNLRRLVRNIDAQAGIEFEMIVPGVKTDEDEDLEPDYDTDERVSSISDAEDFFFDGDYNSRRDIRNLVEAMQEEFFEWQMEQLDRLWGGEGLDYLRDYIDNNGIFDRDDYMDEARDQIMNANPDMPVDSDEFLDLVSNRVDKLADAFVQTSWSNQDEHYDQAREEFNEEFMGNYDDEEEWLSDQGLNYMSNVQERYMDEIQWPHYSSTGGGEMSVDAVAEDFSNAIGRPVNAASSYHGARREAGTYVVEPDGSLEGDDDDDGGLEFVSPPLPLDELLSDMEKVRAWAKQRGCYTNSSTGLHMNISVPDTSTSKLDYVKLALLLGDEHVLREFGRSSNNYAGSALKKIRDIVQNKPEAATQVLNKMRDHMEALATKVIHSGETQKFTSINTKGDYVEFRSPGGDWLDANWDRVTPTLLRTVVALDAAMDPAKYRREYQKKLYKLLDSTQQQQTPESMRVNQLLSMYLSDDSEGGSREVARKLAKELLAKRDPSRKVQEPGPADGKPVAPGSGRWGLWITGLDKFATRNNERLEFDSREAARDWYADQAMMRPGIRSDVEVREIPKQPEQGSGAHTYRVYNTSNNQTVGTFQADGVRGTINADLAFSNYLQSIGRDSVAGFNYELIGSERPQAAAQRAAAEPAGAALPPMMPLDIEVERAPRTLTTPGQPQQTFSGEWKIVDPDGRELHRFGGVGNVQADANRVAMAWLRQNPRHWQEGLEVLPVMSE